ncbi:TRAP transporter TatT component family protein [Planctomycetota bacterium]
MRAHVILVLLLLSACGGRRYGWETGPRDDRVRSRPLLAKVQLKPASDAAETSLWDQRDHKDARRSLIALLETRTAGESASDYQALVRLSRLYYLEGQAEDERAQQLAAYEQGMRFGDRALHTFSSFREHFEATGAVEKAVLSLGEEAIAAIYWNAVNTGKWAKSKGLVKILFYKDRVREMIEHARSLNPGFFHGAPDRYLGAYFAALPTVAGRDLARSKEHFDRTLVQGAEYLGTRVTMAEYYAVAKDDPELYRSLLEEVLAAPGDRPADVAAEQRMAKARAARMLDEIEDLFDVDF